jgi:hypothetical protein
MRRWGFIVTAFYAVIVLVLAAPVVLLLEYREPTWAVLKIYEFWGTWLYVGILAAGEALLLFLSVDTSWRHAKPRQYIAVTAIYTSFFAAVLMGAALLSIEVAVYGLKAPPLWKDREELFDLTVLGIWIGLWVIWGGVFYQYYRDSSNIVSRIVTWLLRGSVLELIIAVPAHVIARQRGECTAPVVTGFGIVTGLAIMLLCFGPGVLALYKKRLDAYSRTRQKLS